MFLHGGGFMFTGVYTALITPFDANGNIDYPALGALLEAQINAKVDGLVLLGTTAEAATMTPQEKQALLDFAVNKINGRVKIIIGTGTNNTVTTLENTRAALAYKPDGVLVVTPYYNKPNPAGLIAHYQAVAQLGTPIVLYHIPGRTGLKVPAGVMNQLLEQVPQIRAVKESDYDMAGVTDFAVKHAHQVNYLCGNDDMFLSFLSIGASGIISAAANIFAPAFVAVYQAFKAGDTQKAWELYKPLYPLIKACYFETNPTCVKYILARLNKCTDTVRLPLGPVGKESKGQIDALLQRADANLFI